MEHNQLLPRVQVPASSDAWMRGDRYGNLLKVTNYGEPNAVAHVLLDKSNKVQKFLLCDCVKVQP
jgi:hypothetical protein